MFHMQPVNLNLDTLRTFLVSYDLGGYAQAAERLGRTPSAVSVQMKRLQEDAGTNLFRKRGRSVVLTEAGEIVLLHARRMLRLNDALLDTLRGAELAGSVRLGIPQDFADLLLPLTLARFTQHYPLVQIEVRIDGNASLVDAIASDQLDIALVIGHADRPGAQTLGTLSPVWISAQDYVLPRQQPLPIVALGPQCIFRKTMIEHLDRAGIAWRLAAVSPSLTGLWATATARLGVTIRANIGLPQGLVAKSTLYNLPSLDLALPVTLHQRQQSPTAAVQRFTEIIREAALQMLPQRPRAQRSSKAAVARADVRSTA